jgi:hypothetical protein
MGVASRRGCKEVKEARISPRRHDDHEEGSKGGLMRFARCLNEHHAKHHDVVVF